MVRCGTFFNDWTLGYKMALHIYPVTIQSVSPFIHCLLSRPTPESKICPTLVYFHGLNGTRNQIFQDRYVEFAESIKNLGFNLFSVDLQCHGDRRLHLERPGIENFLKLIMSKEINPFDAALKDIIATTDFLINKDIAVPGKIAVAGLSWGGMHALYALKIERRISCGIAMLPVCKISSMIEFSKLAGDPIIEKYEPLTYVEKIAPKPLLILTTEKGLRSDPKYASELYEKLRLEYKAGNAEQNLAYSMILGAGHAYHPQMSIMVCDWLRKHLLKEPDHHHEPPITEKRGLFVPPA